MFQAFMNHIFADYLWEMWLKIYMDDLGIHTKDDLSLHHEWTWKVLLQLKEHGLTVKLSKTVFDTPHMEFLDMIIGQGKVEMDGKKLDTIQDWKPSTTERSMIVYRICQFLSQIHPELLWHCSSSKLAHSKEWTMEMDSSITNHLRQVENHFLFHPCTPNPWCHLSIFYHDQCIPPHSWSCSTPGWYQHWSTPLCLLLPHLLPCPKKLQHL